MQFRVYVYAAIAHNLGNVAKSRVNAELHATFRQVIVDLNMRQNEILRYGRVQLCNSALLRSAL